jgi:hypothetical protein
LFGKNLPMDSWQAGRNHHMAGYKLATYRFNAFAITCPKA